MTIQNIKDILNRKFKGSTIDDVQGISDFTVFEEAASSLLSLIDPYETIRHGELNLYNSIYDYSLSSTAPDLKEKKVIDLRPQANRSSSEDFRQTFIEDFDRDKEFENDWFSVEFDEATKFLRVNKEVSNSITITDLEDDNYTAGTGVSNIAEDTILHYGDGKSIRFDISLGSNLLAWSGDAVVDLSDHELKSSLFLPVYWPDSSLITSITLRIGTDASNYFEITGSIHFGSVRNGWNLYTFDWNGATETGSVDTNLMDYARFAIVATSADTDIRIGKLSSKLLSPHELVYYSNCIFRPSSGTTWLTKPTAVTDIVNLEHVAQNIFLYECCVIVAEDLQFDEEAQKYRNHLGKRVDGTLTGEGLYGDYRKNKPSEAIRPTSRYYSTPQVSRRQIWRR